VKELKTKDTDLNELLVFYYSTENDKLKTELKSLYNLWTMRVFFRLTKNSFIVSGGNLAKFFANFIYRVIKKNKKNDKLKVSENSKVTNFYNQVELNKFKRIFILIGHEASATGAPVVLLELAQQLKEKNSLLIFLNKGGILENEYIKNFPTKILSESKLTREEQNDFLEFLKDMSQKEIEYTILLNTVAQDFWVDFLITHEVDYSTWIHELNTSWNFWPDTFEKQIMNSRKIIADSELIKTQLESRFGTDMNIEFIKNGDSFEIRSSIEEVKEFLNIKKETLILLAGTRSIRKGFDLLPKLGQTLKQRNQLISGFRILWVGESMHPELDMFINDDITRLNLDENIEIMGTTNNYADYINACDIFVHLSREDSAPQVLELANKLGRPIVQFEGVGGRNIDNQKDNISVSKFLDFENLAKEIERFSKYEFKHQEVGDYTTWPQQSATIIKSLINTDKANKTIEKLEQSLISDSRYDHNQALTVNKNLEISVIIPNYNHEKFIHERLDSVINQSITPAEILLMDDFSSDRSLETASNILEATNIEYKIIANKTNSGNVLKQWEKGLRNAKSDWIWIAESDDSASLDFIKSAQELIRRYNSDIILFESEIIDEESVTLFENSHFNRIHIPTHLNGTPAGQSLTTEIEILKKDGFLIRNLFINVSAIVWRKTCLVEALARAIEKNPPNLVGDWSVYLNLDDKCKITYCDQSLNKFRRTKQSVRFKSELHNDLITSRNFIKKTHSDLYTNQDSIRFEIENLRIAQLND
jgi:glycosyltransferase involved in cell wall biosynthesis